MRLVTLIGKAGTGKTLLALAAGVKRTIEDGAYARLLVSRPVMPLGRDIGFLPGDLDQKLNPWMQPIFDNLEFLLVAGGSKRRGASRLTRSCFESGQLQVEPLTYIRGRSLPTAIVAYNDDTAVAAMGLLAQHGIDVPGRISIVGWDDSEAAALSPVGLTSVAQRPALDGSAGGRAAGRPGRRSANRGSRDRARARADDPSQHRDCVHSNVLTYPRSASYLFDQC